MTPSRDKPAASRWPVATLDGAVALAIAKAWMIGEGTPEHSVS